MPTVVAKIAWVILVLFYFRPEDYTILEVAPADEEMAAVRIQNNNWF